MKVNVRLFLAVIIVSLFPGCDLDSVSQGGSSDSQEVMGSRDDDSERVSAVGIEGGAAKGIVTEGLVSIYQMEGEEWNLLETTHTDSEGRFETSVDLKERPFRISVSSKSSTQMICDAPVGCPGGVEFGDMYYPGDDFLVEGVFPFSAAEEEINITLITSIAARWFYDIPVASDQAADLSLRHIATIFALPDDFYRHFPADLSDSGQVEAASDQAIASALSSAALANLVYREGGDFGALVDQVSGLFLENGVQVPLEIIEVISNEVDAVSAFVGKESVGAVSDDMIHQFSQWDEKNGVTEYLKTTNVPLSSEYDENLFDGAMSVIDRFDALMDKAGIDEEGKFLEEHSYQYGWEYGSEPGIMGLGKQNLWLVSFPFFLSDHALESKSHESRITEFLGRIGEYDVHRDPLPYFARTSDNNGVYSHISLGVTPAVQGVEDEKHELVLDAHREGDQAHSWLLASVDAHFNKKGFAELFAMASDSMASTVLDDLEGPDTDDILEEYDRAVDDMYVDMDLMVDGEMIESGKQDDPLVTSMEGWVELDFGAAILGDPVLRMGLSEGELKTPGGDRLFSHAGVDPVEIEIGQGGGTRLDFGVDAFGWPIMHITFESSNGASGDFSDMLRGLIRGFLEEPGSVNHQDALALLGPGSEGFSGKGTISIPEEGREHGIDIEDGVITVSANNSEEVAFSIHPGTGGNRYLVAGDQLLGVFSSPGQLVGTTLQLVDGDRRNWILGAEGEVEAAGIAGQILGLFDGLGKVMDESDHEEKDGVSEPS